MTLDIDKEKSNNNLKKIGKFPLNCLEETRANRAKEVETAIKVADEARETANKLLNNFVKDYGSFHYSYTTEKPKTTDSVTNDFLKQVFSFLGEI